MEEPVPYGPDLVPSPRAPATWRDARFVPRAQTLVRALRWALGVLFVLGCVVNVGFSARINYNDTSAWSTLRTIAAAQNEFRRAGAIDRDEDAEGEFGTIAELSGAVALPGGDSVLDPPVLSGAFRVLGPDGAVARSGYRFRMYLLADDGAWVVADLRREDIDPEASERVFVCYAWPQRYDTSGRPSLVVDQTGTILHTDDPRYSGPLIPPPWAAPGVGTALHAGRGADGNEWVAGAPRH